MKQFVHHLSAFCVLQVPTNTANELEASATGLCGIHMRLLLKPVADASGSLINPSCRYCLRVNSRLGGLRRIVGLRRRESTFNVASAQADDAAAGG